MHHSRVFEDPARRWRRFCRQGWRMAGLFAALWFGGMAVLFRVAPVPEPMPRKAPVPMAWWPAKGGSAMDVRTLWTPSAFALSTPAGFSHSLRRERAGLPPPVQAVRPDVAFLKRSPSGPPLDLSMPGRPRQRRPSPSEALSVASVFPPRAPVRDTPRMEFPEGWESRIFSGIDLNFDTWTNRGVVRPGRHAVR